MVDPAAAVVVAPPATSVGSSAGSTYHSNGVAAFSSSPCSALPDRRRRGGRRRLPDEPVELRVPPRPRAFLRSSDDPGRVHLHPGCLEDSPSPLAGWWVEAGGQARGIDDMETAQLLVEQRQFLGRERHDLPGAPPCSSRPARTAWRLRGRRVPARRGIAPRSGCRSCPARARAAGRSPGRGRRRTRTRRG